MMIMMEVMMMIGLVWPHLTEACRVADGEWRIFV